MKLISLNKTYPQDWIRQITHIANLFFEDSKVAKKEQEVDLKVHFTSQVDEDYTVHATCELQEQASGAKFYTTFDQPYETLGTDREQNIRLKRAVSYVLLEALEQLTDMHQKWGILTGIRPTKLYHKFRKQGYTKEAIREKLVTEFRLSHEKIDLLERIVAVQLKTIPDLDTIGDEVSIYIGIPFCPTKCAYCTFPAYAIQSNRKQGRVNTFLDGLHIELERMGQWLTENNMKITSIYWGGEIGRAHV